METIEENYQEIPIGKTQYQIRTDNMAALITQIV